MLNSQNNEITQNPYPCSESRNSDAGKAAFHCLRALSVGPGFLLRVGSPLACRTEPLSCLHYLYATRSLSHFHRLNQSFLKLTTMISRTFYRWRSLKASGGTTDTGSGVVIHTASSAVGNSRSSTIQLSTTYCHKRRAAAISSGISYCAVSSVIHSRRIERSSSGFLTFSTVQNQLFISSKSSVPVWQCAGRGFSSDLSESHRMPCNAMERQDDEYHSQKGPFKGKRQ